MQDIVVPIGAQLPMCEGQLRMNAQQLLAFQYQHMRGLHGRHTAILLQEQMQLLHHQHHMRWPCVPAHNLLPSDPLADGLLNELRTHSVNIRTARLAKLQEEVASLAKISFLKVLEPAATAAPAHILCAPTLPDVPHVPPRVRLPEISRKRRHRIARAQVQSPLGRKMHSRTRVQQDPSSPRLTLDTSSSLNSREIAGPGTDKCVTESAAQDLLALSLQSSHMPQT